jgi:hypothetical protein
MAAGTRKVGDGLGVASWPRARPRRYPVLAEMHSTTRGGSVRLRAGGRFSGPSAQPTSYPSVRVPCALPHAGFEPLMIMDRSPRSCHDPNTEPESPS